MMPYGIDSKYEVIKTLHNSAATAVMLVKHRHLQEIRVLKFISKDSPLAYQILSEANLLTGKYNHPGLPTIFDVVSEDTGNYLVEEYVQGTSLLEYLLNREVISLAKVIEISIGLCDIIGCLHETGDEPVLYQDMKPEHIILTDKGIRLIDLGAACPISQVSRTYYGTIEYASYEQLNHGQLDVRTDVCLIGIMIEFMSRYMSEKEKICLAPIVNKATNQDKDERYQSVSSLREQLLRLKVISRTDIHQKKHFLSKIVVIGSAKSTGVTHIALSVTTFLNKKGIRAYYVDRSGGRVLQKLMDFGPSIIKKGQVIYHENFYGFLEYGPAVIGDNPPDELMVVDAGTNDFEVSGADVVIYVGSGSLWQQERELPSFAYENNCIVMCNFPTKGSAHNLAVRLKKKVMAFPNCQTPFVNSSEVVAVLERALEKWIDFEI